LIPATTARLNKTECGASSLYEEKFSSPVEVFERNFEMRLPSSRVTEW
jgi:hypothetical protein